MTLESAWLDGVADALIVVDDGGVIVRASAACFPLLGYMPDELEGQLLEVLVPPQVVDHVEKRASFADAQASRSMGAGKRLSAVRRDGSHVPVDISLAPVEVSGRRYVVASVRDMSEQHRLSAVLRLQALALDSAANGVVITDRDGVVTWANPAFSRMTGYPLAEILGKHTRVLKSGVHDAGFYAALWNEVLAGKIWSGEIVNRRRDGTVYREEQTITPVADASGKVTHFIAIKQDVTDRHEAAAALRLAHEELKAKVAQIEELNRTLQEEAVRDPLTGLFNRRYFEATMDRETARLARESGTTCLVVLDLDDFKLLNDTHGHAAGDAVLKHVGGLLRAAVRASDIPCRFGGEEFVIALLGAPLELGAARAESVRRAIAQSPIATSGAPVTVTASFGVALHDPRLGTLAEALEAADRALYEAKHAGRNCVKVAG